MAELTVDTIIKVAIGIAVVAIVIIGVALAFKTYIMPFFQGMGNFSG